MKAIVKSEFPQPEHEALSEKLLQLTHELPIASVFYHSANATEPPHVIIITVEPKDVEVVESRKWIKNGSQQNGVLFHVMYQGKMDFN